ncbi:heme exporter protein CcmD [Salmonella enterica subsp. enterica serovar Enteritidis]|nr:heme exporter protein CcmD [Salmonella enterica subsp. enterica serovar Enteritidis]
MSPAFSSWSDFFAMGGYAFFVWLAVAMTVALQRAREARMRAAQAQQEAA